MSYVSALGSSVAVDFRTALLRGLAEDGSLYVPSAIPRLPDAFLDSLHERSFHDIACAALLPFVDGMPPSRLRAIVESALDFPIPLVPLEGPLHLLELFHGPTLAFKDVGARFMARCLSHFVEDERAEVGILVATSGDTGGAVASGFLGAAHVTVFVLYPSGRISDLQERQIATLGGNVRAVEVLGSFDDCQRLVKRALAEGGTPGGRRLTTANSINVGRLLPQITYYLWGYAQWRRAAGPSAAPPNVVVPSGNFGNLTAAAYARALGMPVGRLIAATNANDVVPRFLATGRYEPRDSVTTLSTAMDVGDPSNLSRLTSLAGGDASRLASAIEAGSATDADTLREIAAVAQATGIVIDPHTAVGVHVARSRARGEPTLVLATAHPAKFPGVVRRALGREVPLPPRLAEAASRPKSSRRIPADYRSFRTLLEG